MFPSQLTTKSRLSLLYERWESSTPSTIYERSILITMSVSLIELRIFVQNVGRNWKRRRVLGKVSLDVVYLWEYIDTSAIALFVKKLAIK